MIFINALKLVELAIENGILATKGNSVFVCLKGSKSGKEKWVLMDKHILAQQLMHDTKGQQLLIQALKERQIEFNPSNPPNMNG